MREDIKFGTGGWRALIGVGFTQQNVYRLSTAICQYLRENDWRDKPILIGFDRRFLSYDAACWTAETLCSDGLRVYMMNRTAPTPLLMHTVMTDKLHLGVQITASHNPSEYNGVKIIIGEGRDAPKEVTDRLEALCLDVPPDFKPSMTFAECRAAGLIDYLKNPFNDYMDAIESRIDMRAIRERGLRVLLDPMYGSGVYPLTALLYTARCTVDTIHSGRDAYFGGGMPAPSEDTLHELAERVSTKKYDLGLALDGDGDRLGVIDERGRYIGANDILVMLYYYLHEYKGRRGPVVRNCVTTHMLDAVANALGEECVEVPVGFKYISKAIDRTDAVLGGESSGGLTVRGHIHGKDSVYAAMLFVEMLCVMNKRPSEIMRMLRRKCGVFEMDDIAIRFPEASKDDILKRMGDDDALRMIFPDTARISREDGLKIYLAPRGFVSCRFSGTEALLRVCAEANSQAAARRLTQTMRAYALKETE